MILIFLLIIVFGAIFVPIYTIAYFVRFFSAHSKPQINQKSISPKGTIETIPSPPRDDGDIDDWVNYWGEI